MAKGSSTETFAALRLEIDNWRWAGVPVFIRAGKELAMRVTEVRLVFRRPPRLRFVEHESDPNQIVLRIDPSAGLRAGLTSKGPQEHSYRQVHLDMLFAAELGEPLQPYERLLADAVAGDDHLFTREDSVEETWRIVQRVPGLKTAMFSIFEPGKHLPKHRGPYNGVLRLHLGLMVPEPRENAAIRVGPQVLHWQEGRVLIFDDAYEHEAWNRTGALRVVLFVDFVRPLRFPANLLNWLLLNVAVFTPFVREGYDNHREWERRFYA